MNESSQLGEQVSGRKHEAWELCWLEKSVGTIECFILFFPQRSFPISWTQRTNKDLRINLPSTCGKHHPVKDYTMTSFITMLRKVIPLYLKRLYACLRTTGTLERKSARMHFSEFMFLVILGTVNVNIFSRSLR